MEPRGRHYGVYQSCPRCLRLCLDRRPRCPHHDRHRRQHRHLVVGHLDIAPSVTFNNHPRIDFNHDTTGYHHYNSRLDLY